MENSEYHARPEVSASQLKILKRSPLHFWDRFLNPDKPMIEPTPNMILGTLVHAAVLEPEQFDKRYIVVPEGIDKRTKEGKQLWQDLLATGREPVKFDVWQDVSNMAQAVIRNADVKKILDMSQKEVSLFWTDSDTGVLCKMRPDILIEPCDEYPNGAIFDLKTMADCSPESFGKAVWNLEMLIQAGHYCNGCFAANGCFPDFGWIAVETSRPHAVQMYSASQLQIDYGRDECSRLLRIYAECAAANNWPAYGDDVLELELPGWAARIVDGEDDGSVEVSDAE